MKKGYLLLAALLLSLVLWLLPMEQAYAESMSGTCGENATWALDENGVLAISGEGEIEDCYDAYEGQSNYPWEAVRQEIKSVVIGEGITNIPTDAFSYCANLELVEIPGSVTSIGAWCFDGCSSLKSVVIPDGVTVIPMAAFSGCTGLVSVVLPESLETIEFAAFSYCKSLSSIVIPKNLTRLDSMTFDDCTSLKEVTINVETAPEWGVDHMLDSIYGSYLLNYAECVYVVATAEYSLTDYMYQFVADEHVYIDDVEYSKYLRLVTSGSCGDNLNWEMNGHTLVISGTGAMDDYEKYTGPTNELPNFAPWYNLRGNIYNVEIEAGVTYIGENAFQMMTQINSMWIYSAEVAKNLDRFSDAANGVEEVWVESSVSEVGSLLTTFYTAGDPTVYYDGREYVTYTLNHDGVCGETVVWDYTQSTGTLTIQGSGPMYDYGNPMMDYYYQSPFSEHRTYYTVIVEEGVTHLGNYAFFFTQESLYDIQLPMSLVSIGNGVFEGTYGFGDIHIPENVTSIGYGTFSQWDRGRAYIDSASLVAQLTSEEACGGLAYCTLFIRSDITDVPVYVTNLYPYTETVMHNGVEYVGYSTSACDLKGCQYEATVVEPTCYSKGYTLYTCTVCGNTKKEDYVDKVGHSYREEIVEPTCTSMGYTKKTCVYCGEIIKSNYTNMIEHAWEVTEVKAPTCADYGWTKYTCSICGGTKKDYNYAYEACVLGEERYYQEPTCTYGGGTYGICVNCGYARFTDYEPALGHEWNERYECTRCGEVSLEREALLLNENGTYTTHGGRQVYINVRGSNLETIVNQSVEFGYAEFYFDVTYWPMLVEAMDEEGYVPLTEETMEWLCRLLFSAEYSVVAEENLEVAFFYLPPCTHNYVGTVTEATCVAQGYTTYVCEMCGNSYVDDYTELTEHVYMQIVTEATCTENGFTLYVCTTEGCDHSYADAYTEATGHAWDEGTVTTEPTEDATGIMTYSCVHCGLTRTEVLPELDHVHQFEATVTKPTCEEAGYTTYTCDCGESYIADEVAAAGHEWTGGDNKAPSCTEPGYKKDVCTVCGTESEARETPALGHNWIAATCTMPRTCAACAETEGETLPHSWNHSVVKEPTCTEAGISKMSCPDCGMVQSYPVDSLGHSEEVIPGKTATCAEAGLTEGKRCTVCGEMLEEQKEIAMLEHVAGEWEIVKEATETETGLKQQVCTNCGKVLAEEEIPMLEHQGPADTGNSAVLLFAMVALMSAVTSAIVLTKKKYH